MNTYELILETVKTLLDYVLKGLPYLASYFLGRSQQKDADKKSGEEVTKELLVTDSSLAHLSDDEYAKVVEKLRKRFK